jgi:hemerythrin-like domain-containing protein
MKRASTLTGLSHQHQHGLAVALQLRRASAESAPEAESSFLTFWQEEGERHLRLEEELLLPTVAREIPPAHEAVVRVLVEHVDLRCRASELELAPVAELDALHEVGDRLYHHIRHEERVLFPLVEQALSNEQLAQLAAALARAERPQ